MAGKRKTNTQFLRNIMEHSKTNPALMQAFIIDALAKQSEAVVVFGKEKLRKRMGDNAFVNPDAWYDVAKELKDAIEAHLK